MLKYEELLARLDSMEDNLDSKIIFTHLHMAIIHWAASPENHPYIPALKNNASIVMNRLKMLHDLSVDKQLIGSEAFAHLAFEILEVKGNPSFTVIARINAHDQRFYGCLKMEFMQIYVAKPATGVKLFAYKATHLNMQASFLQLTEQTKGIVLTNINDVMEIFKDHINIGTQLLISEQAKQCHDSLRSKNNFKLLVIPGEMSDRNPPLAWRESWRSRQLILLFHNDRGEVSATLDIWVIYAESKKETSYYFNSLHDHTNAA